MKLKVTFSHRLQACRRGIVTFRLRGNSITKFIIHFCTSHYLKLQHKALRNKISLSRKGYGELSSKLREKMPNKVHYEGCKSLRHTSGVSEAIFCASKAIDALICLAFSIFGIITEAPALNFSMNLCFSR